MNTAPFADELTANTASYYIDYLYKTITTEFVICNC